MAELDWAHTVHCTNEWPDDALLSHLCSNAFTIPPRDYNPSAPFVCIKSEEDDGDGGVLTTLPHGYRLPLMFIAKYQWDTTCRILSVPVNKQRKRWVACRDEILHLSRLCRVLLLDARAKAESGGMEKGWRCIVFDRFLTRFYRGWSVGSPAKLDSFLARFGPKEYERDILKYDWKRWVLKGFSNSSSRHVALTEEDINNGITAAAFKSPLSKINNLWTISTGTERIPIKFMQPSMDCSSSELTDLDLSDDPDLDEDLPPIIRNNNLQRPLFIIESPTKRGREPSEDEADDPNNRSGKRAKLEEIIRSISSPPPPPPPLAVEEGQDKDDLLPKFKVPRKTLHSHGWKRRDDVLRPRERCEREEEDEEEAVVDAIGVNNNNTSDYPMNDPSSSTPNKISSAQDKPLSTSISVPSNSKGKQPASTSTPPPSTNTSDRKHTTIRFPQNSAYVSIPRPFRFTKPFTKPPVKSSSSNTTSSTSQSTVKMGHPKPDSKIKVEEPSFEMEEGGKKRKGKGRRVKTRNGLRERSTSPAPVVVSMRTRSRAGAGSKEKEKAVKAKEVKEKKSVPGSGSSSSSSSALADAVSNNDDGVVELEKATNTTIPIPDPPLPDLALAHAKPIELEHIPDSHPISEIACSASSSPSLPSLTPSSPGLPTIILNGGDVDVEANIDAEAQARDRYRELKASFLVLRDRLGGIIGGLEGLEGGAGWEAERESGGGCLDYVCQGSQTEGSWKGKGKDGCESEDVLGYVDVAVGLDASLVTFRDIAVQTHKPGHAHSSVASPTAIAVQTADLSNAKPTQLESKNDDALHLLMNTPSNNSLASIVDNLVSVKMLSMMQSLVKSSSSTAKPKLVENSTITATNESDSDILRQPSPSTSSLASASHSIEAYDTIVSSLVEELKGIKEEARCRERNEKEDLLAMRQLHSAEVDALRRRLAYLESRNMSFGRWERERERENEGGSGRWSGRDSSLDLDRRQYQHHRYRHHDRDDQLSTSFRQQCAPDRPHLSNGLDRHHSSSSSTVNPESEPRTTSNDTPQSSYNSPLSFKKNNQPTTTSTTTTTTTTMMNTESATNSLPTPTPPTPSERYHPHHHSYGFSKNGGMDLDDDIGIPLPLPLPLPVKSQRKHHMMALARAHFS